MGSNSGTKILRSGGGNSFPDLPTGCPGEFCLFSGAFPGAHLHGAFGGGSFLCERANAFNMPWSLVTALPSGIWSSCDFFDHVIASRVPAPSNGRPGGVRLGDTEGSVTYDFGLPQKTSPRGFTTNGTWCFKCSVTSVFSRPWK